MDRTTRIKLRRLLAELYEDSRKIRQIITDAGLAAARIDLSGSAENIWHDVLSEAEKAEKVEQLIETVCADRPEKQSALDAILGRASDNPATPASTTQAVEQSLLATSAPQPTTAPAVTPPPTHAIPIDLPRTIQLTALDQQLIGALFQQATKVRVLSEFSDGRTATRVLLVRATDAEGVEELPTVVKLGSRTLIEPEWQATQQHVLRRLPGFIPTQGDPVYLSQADGGMMGALRYGQVGEGVFASQNLAHYVAAATLVDSWHVLEKRLFVQLGHLWRSTLTWQPLLFQTSYDAILPVNLIVTPVTAAIGSTMTPLRLDGRQLAVTDTSLPLFQAGDLVQIENFIVTESERSELTLNLPHPPNAIRTAYRLRLQSPTGGEYRLGTTLPATLARVTSTRADLLRNGLESQLGDQVDLAQSELPFAGSTLGDAAINRLPNPLLALPALLARRHEAKFATIHGDLNLRNILVDTEARTTHIIDCASARQDHALHDLLRLERDFLTAVLPQLLFAANLPPTSIVRLYQAVHCATRGAAATASEQFSLPGDLPVSLHKPFVLLVTVRRAAHDLLARAGQWDEYYTGLILHLLGALKYRDLDQAPAGHQPKALAFWGAAITLALLREMETGLERTCRGIHWRFFDVTQGEFTEAISKGLTLPDSLNTERSNRGTLEAYTPPTAASAVDVEPVRRRLDVAAPQQATRQRAFSLAVAVRQLASPPLQLPELPEIHSGKALLDWPDAERFVRLRVEVVAPECEIVGAASYTFKLYHNLDSEIYYFSLIPKVTGRLNILVHLYQAEDMLGSASAYTTVGEQMVSAVPVPIRSEAVTMKPETAGSQPGAPSQETPNAGAAPLKILFLAANPLDTVRLRTDEEARAIDLALRQSDYRVFDIRPQSAVRVDDLPGLLMRHTPDILHFSGHGSTTNELLFHNTQGQAQPVRGAALRELFRLLKGNIRCIILNACYSEEQARTIAEAIDCVVGIDEQISDEASLQFATAFYRALGYGKSVQEAFDLGRLQIELAGLGDAAMFHLHEIQPNAAQIRFAGELPVNTTKPAPTAISTPAQPSASASPAPPIPTPAADQDFLRSLLAQHQRNRQRLLQQKALYGAGEEPLRLLNQLDAEEEAIAAIKQQLSE